MNQSEFHQNTKTSYEVNTFEKVKRLLDFEYGPKLKILDVGSGSGMLDLHLAKLGHDVTAIDLQEPQHENVRNNNVWQFNKADISQTWPSADKTFDLVICTDVPEHMYYPEHILQEAQRVLKDDGQLIFGVPNHFDIRQRLRLLVGQGIVHWDNIRHGATAWDYGHIRFFTPHELEEKFSQTGLHIAARQFNFMGAGVVPSWSPEFLRLFLLEAWPGLFSGKFVYLLSKTTQAKQPRLVLVSRTKSGM